VSDTEPILAAKTERIRELFPGTRELVYFNAAAQGLLPTPTVETMGRVARAQSERGIMSHFENMDVVEAARQAAARLIGCTTEHVAFTAGTADGISKLAEGLDWRERDEVVLCDLEFPANVYPWAAQQKHGARVRLVTSVEGRIEAGRLIEAIGPRTRVVAVSHVQFGSGYRIDLPPLADACRRHGAILVVDAIQSLGVVPLDLEGIDALAVEGRKWLLGPPGCGLLYVAPGLLERLRPGTLGARSVRNPDDLLQYSGWLDAEGRIDLQPRLQPGSLRFEGGYPNVVGIAGLGRSLQLAEEIERDFIRRRIAELVARFVERLEAAGFAIYGPRTPGERAGIVSFELPAGDPESLFHHLNREGYSLAVREGRIRVAPHVYNKEDEVDAVVQRIVELTRA
jgi:selenocysteine lyase/cysteine desulfurase